LEAGSAWPFVYALLSLAFFVPLSWWMFDLEPEDRLATLSRIGLGSVGGILLVYFFGSAAGRPALISKVLGGPAGIAIGAIGLADAMKDAGSLPIWISILCYTLSVGLVEEASKAIAARSDRFDSLRARAAFGFVAGVGFGCGEAILYSFRNYAGSADLPIYVLRFVFCVGFHGAMSGIAVLSLPEDWWDFDRWLVTALRLLPIAFLHGAYDAFLVRSCPIWAGIVATATFLILPVLLWSMEEGLGEV
jgi:RsiW-degrading membrane proteinase PrsW (M82 family)